MAVVTRVAVAMVAEARVKLPAMAAAVPVTAVAMAASVLVTAARMAELTGPKQLLGVVASAIKELELR